AATDEIVIRNHYAADRPQQSSVTDQPGKNVFGQVCVKLPRKNQDTQHTRDYSAALEADNPGPEVREVIRRRDYIGGNVCCQGGNSQSKQRKTNYQCIGEAT